MCKVADLKRKNGVHAERLTHARHKPTDNQSSHVDSLPYPSKIVQDMCVVHHGLLRGRGKYA